MTDQMIERERVDERVSMTSGVFQLSFDDCLAAQAAARDSRAKGFTVEVARGDSGRWHNISRRREVVPADEIDRYASRLNAIALLHNGVYDGFTSE